MDKSLNQIYGSLAFFILLFIPEYLLLANLDYWTFLNFLNNEKFALFMAVWRPFYVFVYFILSNIKKTSKIDKITKKRSDLRATGVILGLIGVLGFSTVQFHDWLVVASYPLSLVLVWTFLPLLIQVFKQKPAKLVDKTAISCDSQLIESKERLQVNIQTYEGWINFINPFRSIITLGTAGAGKTFNFLQPILAQFSFKCFTMLTYDYKGWEMTNFTYNCWQDFAPDNYNFYVISLADPKRSHRLNIVDPRLVYDSAYAEEYALSLLANFDTQLAKKKTEFFTLTTVNLLTCFILYFKRYYAKQCTLPHIIAAVCNGRLRDKWINRFVNDPFVWGYVSSIGTAHAEKAKDQLAGQYGSLQNIIGRFQTPELFWIFSGSDFTLDINNPADPKYVSVATKPSVAEAHSPIVGMINTVATKVCNTQNRLPLYFNADEFYQAYMPNADSIPATGRSNYLVCHYLQQDISQFIKKYGQDTFEAIFSVCGAKVTGQVGLEKNAKIISAMFGKDDKIIKTVGESVNTNQSGASQGLSQSETTQLRDIMSPARLQQMYTAEFAGIQVGEIGNEPEKPVFTGNVINWKNQPHIPGVRETLNLKEPFPEVYPDLTNDLLEKHFLNIIQEAIDMADDNIPKSSIDDLPPLKKFNGVLDVEDWAKKTVWPRLDKLYSKTGMFKSHGQRGFKDLYHSSVPDTIKNQTKNLVS